MKRALAVDPGTRRVGLAVSDAAGCIALPLTTLTRERKTSDRVRRIVRLAVQHEVDCIVVGLPLEMSGAEGPAAAASRELAARLAERSGLPVELVDERLTSVQADQDLARLGVRPERRRDLLDEAAAVLILRDWMERPASRAAGGRPPGQTSGGPDEPA